MNKEEHMDRHKILHKELDELVADFINHTKGLPSATTVIQLMSWSLEQTANPTEEE